ncbi:hypothetical protein QYE76_058661 [Lolium multiflorum]|uniref:F-box domain-containing protein n=1 Tax=Lolium multiflorum TaxID=4521 RepID=A0AAD8T606_LOLMU|nr:hypothetical protein QYE76_058661 [Lolium multiflorum]
MYDPVHMMQEASIPPWYDLPPELLGHVFTRLQCPANRVTSLRSAADCARARTVCRSWHSAMRDHHPPWERHPTWVVLPDCCYLTYPEDWSQRCPTSLPDDVRCVGSTDNWLALVCLDEDKKRHRYMMYNPFSYVTMQLPELDTVIGIVPKSFNIRKVLMRSTPDDIIILMPTSEIALSS